MNRIFLGVLVAFPLACAHQGGFSGGFFVKSDVRYYVGNIPAGWRLKSFKNNDIAYVSEDAAHIISVNATCEGYEDASLEVLTRHLVIGFTERKLLHQELRMLDGREALASRYLLKMDGVPVELMLVVIKKDKCVYDFWYIAPPGRFEEKLGTFEEILKRFHSEPRP